MFIHARVEKIKALPDFILLATFVGGIEKTYDMKPWIEDNEAFKPLAEIKGLFESVRVDCGGCGIVWNDDIDLDSHEIWVDGKEVIKPKKENLTAGDVLKEEFLKPFGVSQYKLANDIGVSKMLISKIINGQCAISADVAVRLAKYFGTTPEFWLNMQNACDVRIAEDKLKEKKITIPAFCPA
ncbi:MAG: HigA family addiction module antidote protein [Alphaproteobacteria bacterium]|nr:HigA family addiction module antidote protein [Alphaproteobacteria bacterium]